MRKVGRPKLCAASLFDACLLPLEDAPGQNVLPAVASPGQSVLGSCLCHMHCWKDGWLFMCGRQNLFGPTSLNGFPLAAWEGAHVPWCLWKATGQLSKHVHLCKHVSRMGLLYAAAHLKISTCVRGSMHAECQGLEAESPTELDEPEPADPLTQICMAPLLSPSLGRVGQIK